MFDSFHSSKTLQSLVQKEEPYICVTTNLVEIRGKNNSNDHKRSSFEYSRRIQLDRK